MSWICQYKDPVEGDWKEKEFEFEEQAIVYGREIAGTMFYTYHS